VPYLIIKDAKRALDFYQKAFNGKVRLCVDSPRGGVGHAEVLIGDSVIMLAEECPEMNAKSPQTIGDTPVSICLYVEKVDEVFNQALAEGAQSIMAVTDQFYGDRSGMLKDPFGHVWYIATHVKDVSPEEIAEHFAKAKKH